MEGNKRKPVRYMDFVGGKPRSASDPLASRPASRPVKKPALMKPVASVSDQIPSKGSSARPVQKPALARPAAKPAPKPAPETPAVTVKKSETKPYISRTPAKSRDLYPEPRIEKSEKSAEKPIEKKPAPKSPDNNAYSLGGRSPFLKGYNVDKRPLSDSVPKKKPSDFEKVSYLGVSETGKHKNIYEKAEKPAEKSAEKLEKESKHVKIIDDSEKKHGLPVWLIIIVTILLGAAVGAGVYFLLPK